MIPRVEKPPHWNQLAFYQKIAYYGTQLTEDHSQYVDKLRVKELVGNRVKTANVVKILDSIDDLRQQDIHSSYLIKGAHGCKFNINLTDNMPVEWVKQKLRSFCKLHDPYQIERQYHYIKPQFFIEEKVNDFLDGKNERATVFMIRCIDGKAVSIGIICDDKMDNYYIDWTPIHLEIPRKRLDTRDPQLRQDVQRMMQTAEELSTPFEFVRMDFYLDRNRDIYLSEFTFTPSGGKQVYPSYEVEMALGSSWR